MKQANMRVLSRYLKSLPDRLLERVRPIKPPEWYGERPQKLEQFLDYEAALDLCRPTILLSDGSLGVCWELAPIEHEAASLGELESRLEKLSDVFNKTRDERVVFQVLFDSAPTNELETPEVLKAADLTNAQKILLKRIESVKTLGAGTNSKLRLMKRRVWLTLRLMAPKAFDVSVATETQIDAEFIDAAKQFESHTKELKRLGDEVEFSLNYAGLKFTSVSHNEFLSFVREGLHSVRGNKDVASQPEVYSLNENRTIRSQLSHGFACVVPFAISVEEDTWEVASWKSKPDSRFTGMFANLLSLDTPHRVVVNISSCDRTVDLDLKANFLKHATSSFAEMQRDEVKLAHDRLARGDKFFNVSVHVLIRNVGMQIRDVKTEGSARRFISKLQSFTKTEFIIERQHALPIFFSCLPLLFNKTSEKAIGREARAFGSELVSYLPLFGGFRGTKDPMQLMMSRAGDAIWLSQFASQTSGHLVVGATSGAGKSFLMQNLMSAFFAWNPNGLVFIIDKKTSYEIFARVVGENGGVQISKPPANFPNIFRGKLDDFRLPVIVGILKTAINLVSPDARLNAVEEILLSNAVRAAFEQNELDASTEYANGELSNKNVLRAKIPQLSDVVDNLTPIAAKAGIPVTVAQTLALLLSPFIGTGPYANVFDRFEEDEPDPKTPAVSLYDVDAVSGSAILSTLTTQILLSEILRQIRRPENRGKRALLVIEEVGVLASESPEIVNFIRDSWKTFRKLNIGGCGLTNEIDDFLYKPGPREIWNNSPNKILLRLLDKDIQKAVLGDPERGVPPLIQDEYVGELISTLTKVDGEYSQALWWSDETKGTFIYMPNGFDYWCSASKPVEVATVYKVKETLESSYFDAVTLLATHFPKGVKAQDGSLRELSSEEILLLTEQKL